MPVPLAAAEIHPQIHQHAQQKWFFSTCVKIRDRKVFIYILCVGAFWLSLETSSLPSITFLLSCLPGSPSLPPAPPSPRQRVPPAPRGWQLLWLEGLASAAAQEPGWGSLGALPAPDSLQGEPHHSQGDELIPFGLQASLPSAFGIQRGGRAL